MTRLLYADDVTYFSGTTRLLYADDLTFSFLKFFSPSAIFPMFVPH